MTDPTRSPETTPEPRRRARRLLAVGAVTALLVPAAAVAAYSAAPLARSAASDAVAAVLGSGVMTKVGGSFNPGAPAKRGDVAVALHRSMPRIAVQPELASLGASTGFVELGSVRIKSDGARGKLQGVLINVQMQLDHDSALAAGCSASWQLTRGAQPTVLGSWSQELYSGPTTGEEDNIAFSFFVTQPTNKFGNYHLLGANSCTQTLFTDLDMMTAQTFPLNGEGKPFTTPTPKVRTETPRHER